ncbi:hypothetical protein CLOM_g1395, partial [Closterium sp. NIES-68]
LAKTNLHRRKGFPGGGDGYDHSKRARVDTMASFMPGSAAAAMGSFMPAAYDAYASSFASLPAAAPAAPASAPKQYSTHSGPPPGKVYRDNPPCNTLYLGNLGLGVSEAELMQIFSVQPGYVQLKLLRQGMSTCCFVQFVDVEAASAVHVALQGITLASSDRGPVRVQFSRTPLGQKGHRAMDREARDPAAGGTEPPPAGTDGGEVGV